MVETRKPMKINAGKALSFLETRGISVFGDRGRGLWQLVSKTHVILDNIQFTVDNGKLVRASWDESYHGSADIKERDARDTEQIDFEQALERAVRRVVRRDAEREFENAKMVALGLFR